MDQKKIDTKSILGEERELEKISRDEATALKKGENFFLYRMDSDWYGLCEIVDTTSFYIRKRKGQFSDNFRYIFHNLPVTTYQFYAIKPKEESNLDKAISLLTEEPKPLDKTPLEEFLATKKLLSRTITGFTKEAVWDKEPDPSIQGKRYYYNDSASEIGLWCSSFSSDWAGHQPPTTGKTIRYSLTGTRYTAISDKTRRKPTEIELEVYHSFENDYWYVDKKTGEQNYNLGYIHDMVEPSQSREDIQKEIEALPVNKELKCIKYEDNRDTYVTLEVIQKRAYLLIRRASDDEGLNLVPLNKNTAVIDNKVITAHYPKVDVPSYWVQALIKDIPKFVQLVEGIHGQQPTG